MIDTDLVKNSLYSGCPKCGTGSIFPHKLTLSVQDTCPHCDLELKEHDSGDGPAVFLVFILGFLLTPCALILDLFFTIPLWGHAILWTLISLGFCILTMQPLKAYVIALNYKHRDGAKGV